MTINIKPNPVIPLLIGNKKLEYYDSYLVKADGGLHDQIISIVDHFYSDKQNIHILDIASGEGTLAYRLSKNKSFIVDAIDIDAKSFKFPQSISFFEMDLNDQNAMNTFLQQNSGKYDLIISLETIEHLENHWQFIRFLKKCLTRNGKIILTTPNINSVYSKITFLTKNHFFQFADSDLDYGHINPVSLSEIKTLCAYNGLNIDHSMSGGTYPIIWIKRNILFSFIYSISNLIFFFLKNDLKYGWCGIFILSKSNDHKEND